MSKEKSDYVRIGRNTLALFLSNISTKIISFVYMIFLARHLGESGLGQLTFASAFVEVFGIFSDFGLSTVIVREVSRDRGLSERFLRNCLSLRFLLSTSVFIIIMSVAYISGFSGQVIGAIALYGCANVVLSLSFTYQSILNAFEKMYYGSIISIISSVLISITGFIFIGLDRGVLWFASLQLLWAVPTGLAYIFCGRRESLTLSIGIDPGLWKEIMRLALPIGFGVAMYVVYNRVDLIMLKYMRNDYDVGIYSVAYRMMGYFNFLIWAIMGASAPAFSKSFGSDTQRLRELAERSVRYLIFSGIPIAVGGSVLARSIMEFLYNGRFHESAGVFSLLAFSTAIVFFASTFGTILLNADSKMAHYYAWIAAAGVLLNVLLNLFLIPRFSYYGSAAATVVTDLFACLLAFFYVVRNITTVKVFTPLLKALTAALLMASIVRFFDARNVWLPANILIGAAVYAIIAVLLKFFNREDAKILKDLFFARGSFSRVDG